MIRNKFKQMVCQDEVKTHHLFLSVNILGSDIQLRLSKHL